MSIEAKVYIIPQRRILSETEDKYQLIRKSLTPEKIDKLVGGKIKSINTFVELIKYAQNPSLREIEKVSLSPQNWAALFNKIVFLSAKEYKNTPEEKRIYFEKIEIIVKKMLIEIPSCLPGQCSQIAKASGRLQLNNLDLNNWIVNNAISHLESFSVQEFYHLIDGTRNLLSKSDLKKILVSYSNKIVSQNNQILQLFNPHEIVCLLQACAETELNGALSELLLHEVFLQKESFCLHEAVDLIGGLSLFSYTIEGLNLLNQIHQRLGEKTNLFKKSLFNAVNHFAKCGFVPFYLFQKVKNFLNDSNNHLWDKISLLKSMALLGIRKEFVEHFKVLMEAANQTIDGEKAFTRLYLEDIVNLVYIAAVFANMETPIMINEVVEHLNLRILDLGAKERMELIFPLRAFGFFELANQMSQGIEETPTESYRQFLVYQSVADYMSKHSLLKQLKFQCRGNVLGLHVDLLIEGFNEIGIEQKPIVIKFVDIQDYACNIPNHSLGNHYLSSKTLMQAGCEFAIFDMRKGLEAVTKQICAFIRNKNIMWEESVRMTSRVLLLEI